LVTVLLTLSCSANRMYRPVSLEQHPDYSLAFIELDDQGELWAPSQLDRALAHLERLNRSEYGVALVLFVHGWNTDASPREEEEGKGTLYQYRSMLVRLSESIRDEAPGLEVPVMGIYLAWRGRVSSVPLVRQASFYNRRGAAERIAGAPATEAIYRIVTTLRENPASRSVRPSRRQCTARRTGTRAHLPGRSGGAPQPRGFGNPVEATGGHPRS
jgi:hypothetical protein